MVKFMWHLHGIIIGIRVVVYVFLIDEGCVIPCSLFDESEYSEPILIDQLFEFRYLYLPVVQKTLGMLVFQMEVQGGIA